MIHQSRGSGVGSWRFNKIASYVGGTITTALALTNTYIDSGASQAQVLVVKQHSGITIQNGRFFRPKAWDGNVGGILSFAVSGLVDIHGDLFTGGPGYGGGYSTVPTGFRGELAVANTNGKQSEGHVGAGGATTTSANGSGGGGGADRTGPSANWNAGGGAHAGTGGTGPSGVGGSTSGSFDLTTMTFGGAGGSASATSDFGGGGGHGGHGGGIIVLIAKAVTIDNSTGYIKAEGSDGQVGGSFVGAGGGGGGGSILIKSTTASIGTNRIFARGGKAGTLGSGTGGIGRVRIETCSLTGSSSNPSISKSVGNKDWCGSVGQIVEG